VTTFRYQGPRSPSGARRRGKRPRQRPSRRRQPAARRQTCVRRALDSRLRRRALTWNRQRSQSRSRRPQGQWQRRARSRSPSALACSLRDLRCRLGSLRSAPAAVDPQASLPGRERERRDAGKDSPLLEGGESTHHIRANLHHGRYLRTEAVRVGRDVIAEASAATDENDRKCPNESSHGLLIVLWFNDGGVELEKCFPEPSVCESLDLKILSDVGFQSCANLRIEKTVRAKSATVKITSDKAIKCDTKLLNLSRVVANGHTCLEVSPDSNCEHGHNGSELLDDPVKGFHGRLVHSSKGLLLLTI